MEHTSVRELLDASFIGKSAIAKGWVRTKRGNKNVAFIALNDGSIIHNLQLVVDPSQFSEELLKSIGTGACIRAKGNIVASQGSGQGTEMQVQELLVYGEADAETYPLQKKGHTLEFLRDCPLTSADKYFRSGIAYSSSSSICYSQVFQRSQFLLLAFTYYHRFGC